MKILFSGERFYPPFGGAAKSILTLFEELAKKHDASAIFTGRRTEVEKFHNININSIELELENYPSQARIYFLNKIWEKVLDSYVKNNKPDLILTQINLTPSSVRVAKKHGIPIFVFMRSYECICLTSFVGVYKKRKHNCLKHASWKYKIQYPFFKNISKNYNWALKNADLIISNSKFMQSVVKNWYNLNSIVIYPFIRLNDYRVKKIDPRYITLLKPKVWKGIEIFLKIVDRLPKKQFLGVGGTDRLKELKKRKNIKYIPWTSNMKKIYAKTKILLVPSIMPESFGRMAVEAMCNGIPCIVSDIGALPEDVDDAGIVVKNIFDIDSWIDAINRLEDDKLYKKLSKRSVEQAKKFDFKVQYKKFEKIVKKIEFG